jgi:general secretion pathway protein C
MRFEEMLRRYFGVIILAFIAVAAYFQASGITQLLGSALAPPGSWFPFTSDRAPAPPSSTEPDDHATSARAILDRNPFDSQSALALDAIPIAGNGGSSSGIVACDGLKALIALASSDPAWSMAAISSAPEGAAKLVHVGDDFGGKTVELVEWNRVVLSSGAARCEVVMFRSGKTKKEIEKAPPPRVDAGGAPLEIASKIQRLGPTEFNVDRQAVAEIIEKQAELMGMVRIRPVQEKGRVLGLQLLGVRPDNVLGLLGFEQGDMLKTINGFDMTNPENALQAFARLRTADHLTALVSRHEKDTNLDFNIK